VKDSTFFLKEVDMKNNKNDNLLQSRAEQSRAEQSRAEQSRAEQSRAEQSRAGAYKSAEG
jgi:hypothetical protein